MTNKRITKQLMAIGVQRNDATAFARTYRKIMAAGQEDLFPEIVKPVMPVVGTVINCRVTPFRAVYMAPAGQMAFFRENNEEFANRIKYKLSRELCEGLMTNGYITMRIEEIMGVGTQYTATVNVAVPWR